MAIILPGAFNQNANVSVTAQYERLRNAFFTRAYPASATNGNTRSDGQGGVWPQPNALNVTATATPDMNVHVDRGGGLLPGSQNTNQGNYPFFNGASFPVGINPSNTQARIDSIVAHSKDTFYSGTQDVQEFFSFPGTPGSGSPPNLTSLDNNFLEIARVAVGANVSSINNSNITNMQHLLPVGLDIPLSSELSNPGSFVGQPRVNTTSGEYEWWDGSAWRGQKWVAYSPTWAGISAVGTGSTFGGRYFKTGTKCLAKAWIKAGSTGAVTLGTGHVTFTLPFTAANPSTNDQWYGEGSSRPAPAGLINLLWTVVGTGATAAEVLAVSSTNTLVVPGTASIPWTSNSIILAHVEYETAS